jgi:hypothetical protein
VLVSRPRSPAFLPLLPPKSVPARPPPFGKPHGPTDNMECGGSSASRGRFRRRFERGQTRFGLSDEVSETGFGARVLRRIVRIRTIRWRSQVTSSSISVGAVLYSIQVLPPRRTQAFAEYGVNRDYLVFPWRLAALPRPASTGGPSSTCSKSKSRFGGGAFNTDRFRRTSPVLVRMAR